MALMMNVSYKGIPIDNAYIKVAHIDGNKNKMYFNVEYYSNQAATVDHDNCLFISTMYFIVPDLNSSDNFIKQMYDHLKSLDTYKDAIDI